MRIGFNVIASMVVGLLGLGGCDKADPAATPDAATKRTVVIGFVGKSQGNDVFRVAEIGAKDAAAALGPKYGVNVEIDVRTPSAEDAVKQAEAIEALTRRGVDGIAVSCSEAGTVTPAIDKAVEAGIPVMCFDSDAPASKRFAVYACDDAASAEKLMDLLARAMGEKGTIAILAGNQAAPNLQARVAGVKKGLAKYPNMKLLEPNGVFYHAETPEKAAEAVSMATTSNPQIQGWAFVGGWPLFTADALRWPPGQIKVISWDALPPQLGYLTSGHVDVLLGQDCHGWGYKSVETILEKVINSKDPPSQRVVDPLTDVTKANAAEYGKNWERWLGGK